jgi:hypothetical protein
MEANQFSLDKVLADANEKMRELAPDSPPPPVEYEIESSPPHSNDEVTISLGALMHLQAFAIGCGSILSGEHHPMEVIYSLQKMGYSPHLLKTAIEEAQSIIRSRFPT